MTLALLRVNLPAPILDSLRARGVTAAEILAALNEVVDGWLCSEIAEASSIVNPGEILEQLGSVAGVRAEDVLVETAILADAELVEEKSRSCRRAGYDVKPLDVILAAVARALGYKPMRLDTVSILPRWFTPGV